VSPSLRVKGVHVARLLAVLTAPLLAACATTAVPPAATPAPAATPPTAPVQTEAPAPRAPLQVLTDSLTSLPQFANMHWGILVVAPERGDTLAAHNADKLALPASNMKLITGAVAVAQLGPDFRWTTTFARTGPVVNGVLRGDLVVTGRGDPSVSEAMRGRDPLVAFGPLVAALRAAGIRRIAGRVRTSDAQAFPGSPHGFGWDWDDLDFDYGAGVTELLFNEGFTRVHVSGCPRTSRTACVTTSPLRTAPAMHAAITVRDAGSGPPQLTWWRDSAAVPGLTIRGSIAAGDSTAFTAAQPDARVTYVAAVTEALTRAGIVVRGRASSTTMSVTPLATLTSPTLAEVLPVMQKPSQNQVAEVLYRTLALEKTGVGIPDSGRAVVERQLRDWGVRDEARAIRDGSGLSRHDYLTPRAIVQVLDAMRRAPTFAMYRDALPVPGMDGTLRFRMQGLPAGSVQAKTGTVDKARALSGYITTADGELLLFSVIANNHSVPTREVDRAAELLVERLVRLRRSAP
jgi:D-alanyl-D-alanine carboxypeptidase/D-alanyl-D-alanine-endopeptidase (penicillin-binding protein 4)